MSRSYSASEIAMDGIRGAGVFLGVAVLILVALAGFANGYNQIMPPAFERASTIQPELALERARLMEPGELAPVAATASPKLVAKIEVPPAISAPNPAAAEPAVSTVATEVPPAAEPIAGPV